jgi:hypothetical protein
MAPHDLSLLSKKSIAFPRFPLKPFIFWNTGSLINIFLKECDRMVADCYVFPLWGNTKRET